ncbi:MAG: helix-turn-helix domain-containing protein [Comamonadaceae bacterium]|nr:MAG: helix-turn-helix domain-containing protein [Comamonadaceae bacterium]
MIERASEFSASAAMPLLPAQTPDLSAGQMLRQAREAHGLHIDVVAAALKVPTQKLAALESDNIDALPDPVFARALAASVCRALRIDPVPVLDKLPGAPRAALADADRSMSGNIRHQAQRNSVRAGMTGRPSRPLLAVVGLLLVGALVLFLLPQSATEQIGAAWSRLTGSDTTASADGAASADGVVVEATQPLPAPVPAPVVEAPPTPVEPPPPAPASADLLVFVARGEAWIRVAGAGGKTVFERTLKDGETGRVAQAELPLAVTVGRAAVVDVKLRGQPFDLTSIARTGGVARFEVKP